MLKSVKMIVDFWKLALAIIGILLTVTSFIFIFFGKSFSCNNPVEPFLTQVADGYFEHCSAQTLIDAIQPRFRSVQAETILGQPIAEFEISDHHDDEFDWAMEVNSEYAELYTDMYRWHAHDDKEPLSVVAKVHAAGDSRVVIFYENQKVIGFSIAGPFLQSRFDYPFLKWSNILRREGPFGYDPTQAQALGYFRELSPNEIISKFCEESFTLHYPEYAPAPAVSFPCRTGPMDAGDAHLFDSFYLHGHGGISAISFFLMRERDIYNAELAYHLPWILEGSGYWTE